MKKVLSNPWRQMNEYDSAKMLELLGEKSNFQTTENEAEADYYAKYLFNQRKSTRKGIPQVDAGKL